MTTQEIVADSVVEALVRNGVRDLRKRLTWSSPLSSTGGLSGIIATHSGEFVQISITENDGTVETSYLHLPTPCTMADIEAALVTFFRKNPHLLLGGL